MQIFMWPWVLQWKSAAFLAASLHTATEHWQTQRAGEAKPPPPFCCCPLPVSLAILNWLIAEIPALKQCSVRRATAEKIILIRASELIMCNTVSGFHHKFNTLQQISIELKVFLFACLKKTCTQATCSLICTSELPKAKMIRPLQLSLKSWTHKTKEQWIQIFSE